MKNHWQQVLRAKHLLTSRLVAWIPNFVGLSLLYNHMVTNVWWWNNDEMNADDETMMLTWWWSDDWWWNNEWWWPYLHSRCVSSIALLGSSTNQLCHSHSDGGAGAFAAGKTLQRARSEAVNNHTIIWLRMYDDEIMMKWMPMMKWWWWWHDDDMMIDDEIMNGDEWMMMMMMMMIWWYKRSEEGLVLSFPNKRSEDGVLT